MMGKHHWAWMIVSVMALAGPVKAQYAVPAQPTLPTAAPPELQISRDCRTPGLAMSGHTLLPNVMRALKTRKVLTILTIGASARGGRASSDGSYYSIIERMLEKSVPGIDVRLIDRGVSGELAADASQRLMTEVALVQPDLVLWQLGTHDALMQVPVEDFKRTVAESLDWLKAHNVDVVVVGLHYIRGLAKDPQYQAIRAALKRVLEKRNVLRVGRYEAMQVIEQAKRASETGATPNEFSLTEDGYSCMSEYVARAVSSGMFARPPRRAPRL